MDIKQIQDKKLNELSDEEHTFLTETIDKHNNEILWIFTMSQFGFTSERVKMSEKIALRFLFGYTVREALTDL